MRKIRFYSAVVRLFIKRFAVHIFTGILIGLAVFLLRDYIGALDLFSAQERVGVLGQFAIDKLPLSITQEIGTGLTKLDEEGLPQPGLAQKWESKEDGKVWLFTLYPNLKWQDKTPVKAKDLRYIFPNVEISYPDEQHIEFKTSDPYAAFPVLVSRPLFKKGLLGTGDWQVIRINADGQFIEELSVGNIVNGKRKTYRFYESEQQIRSAFKLGEIDAILEISDPKELGSFQNAVITEIVDSHRFIGIFFNTTQPQFSDNKSLRQALAYAVNKKQLGDVRATTPISPQSWAYNPLVKPYEYDTKHAKNMLEKLKSEQKIQSLSIATIPSLLSVAEKIAQDWRDLGFTVTVQVAPGVLQNFQILLAVIEIPPDPDQYSLWHSTQTQTNFTHFNNPRIDKLLEDGRHTFDQNERKLIYLDFQRFLVEEAPAIFLYHPKSYTVRRK